MREQTNAAVNHKFDVRWYFKNKIQRDHSQAKKKKICIQFSLQISFEQNKLCFFVEEKKRIEKPIDLSRALKSQKYFFLMESNLENWISKEID